MLLMDYHIAKILAFCHCILNLALLEVFWIKDFFLLVFWRRDDRLMSIGEQFKDLKSYGDLLADGCSIIGVKNYNFWAFGAWKNE